MHHIAHIRNRSSRGQRRTFLALLAASAVGLMAWSLPATAQTQKQGVVKIPVITVTAGKPTEFGFKLSKTSNLPVGKVTFKVTNVGVIGHSFKICKTAATTAKANACVGTATKVLAKGKSQSITVTFTKKGKYEFLCTVSGHASGGMKGLVGAGMTVTAAEAAGKVTGPTTTTKTTPGTPGTPVAGSCTSPQTTNITVNMVDFSFSGVPGQIPCGTIVFHEVNAGQEDHNISVAGQPPGPVIPGGANATYSVTLGTGTYNYQCDVGDHAGQGMLGSFRVV
jgi:plastocyanin